MDMAACTRFPLQTRGGVFRRCGVTLRKRCDLYNVNAVLAGRSLVQLQLVRHYQLELKLQALCAVVLLLHIYTYIKHSQWATPLIIIYLIPRGWYLGAGPIWQ